MIDVYSEREHITTISKNGSLWLLAHFIALNRAAPTSQGSKYLEALYLQLSILVDDIRIRYSRHSSADEANNDDNKELIKREDENDDSTPFATWILNQLDFLVDEDGISELLSRFTSLVFLGSPRHCTHMLT